MLLLELDNFLNTEALLLEVVTSREKQQHIIKQLRESVEQHSRRRPFSSSALCSVKNGVHRRCIGDVVTATRFDRVELSWDSMEEHMHRLNMTTIMSPGLIIANLPLCQYQKHNLPNSCTFYSATRTQLGGTVFCVLQIRLLSGHPLPPLPPLPSALAADQGRSCESFSKRNVQTQQLVLLHILGVEAESLKFTTEWR